MPRSVEQVGDAGAVGVAVERGGEVGALDQLGVDARGGRALDREAPAVGDDQPHGHPRRDDGLEDRPRP